MPRPKQPLVDTVDGLEASLDTLVLPETREILMPN